MTGEDGWAEELGMMGVMFTDEEVLEFGSSGEGGVGLDWSGGEFGVWVGRVGLWWLGRSRVLKGSAGYKLVWLGVGLAGGGIYWGLWESKGKIFSKKVTSREIKKKVFVSRLKSRYPL